MDDIGSNAQKGSDAVDELIQLLESGHPALLLACDSVLRTIDREIPADWGAIVKTIHRVTGSLKSDVLVSFLGTDVKLAIAVISAGKGNANQVERKPVDSYQEDQGLPDDLIRILKLFTGTTKPAETAQTEFAKGADLSKGLSLIHI